MKITQILFLLCWGLAVWGQSKRLSERSIPELDSLKVDYIQNNDYGNAILCLEMSRTKSKKDAKAYMRYSQDLANLYAATGQFSKAESLYLNVQTFHENTTQDTNSAQYAYLLSDLALMYRNTKRYEEAMPLFEKAKTKLAANKEIGIEHLDYATVLNNLALLYRSTKQYEKAEPLYLEATRIRKNKLGEDHLLYLNSLNNLAFLYVIMDRHEQAKSFYLEAIEKGKKLLGQTHPFYIKMLKNLALLYRKTKDYEKAKPLNIEASDKALELLHKNYKNLPEKQQLQFLSTQERNINGLYQLALVYPDSLLLEKVQDCHLVLKGLSLSSSSAVRRLVNESGKGSRLDSLFEQWQATSQELAQAYAMFAQERQRFGIDLDSLQAKASEQERDLLRNSKSLSQRLKQEQEQVNFRELKKVLGPKEAAIDFIHFPQGDTVWYVALVTKKNSNQPLLLKLCHEELLSRYLGQKTEGSEMNYATSLRQNERLCQLIWQPLEAHLKGIEKIHISPSGLLNRLAFGALLLNRKKQKRLFDLYDLYYYGALRDFVLHCKQSRKTYDDRTALLVGGVNFDSIEGQQRQDSLPINQFHYLEGSQKEIAKIEALFRQKGWNSRTLANGQASESRLDSISGQAPRILHFSTHGFFFKQDASHQKPTHNDQNPLVRSGLVLSGANWAWTSGQDGLLTAYEVNSMDLYNTELVVLSACQTGLGDINASEGVMGLHRAFKAAGVDKAIVSLWEVPDEQTAELMQLFYRFYLKNKDIHTAFRKAQKRARKKYEKTYDWAGFILLE